MNQKLTELDTKFNNLVADIVPNTQNQNVNSSVAQTTPSNSESGTPAIACSSHSKSDISQFRIKPQQFCGTTDFDEFLSQFEITCEINAWQYIEKSLYLANCLTGDARSILSELEHDGRRDYNTLVEKLANRFGSVNRSEIFRTQLKSRIRSKAESIPELAQAIKKLVCQAYPGVNKDVIETLAIDNFIDALTDSDIRLRVRELGPKTLTYAERTALRLESHKIADKQRSRIVGQIDTNGKPNHNEKQVEASSSFKALQNSINSLSDHVQDLKRQNRERGSIRFDNSYSQNNPNFGKTGRANRPRQNDPPPLHNMQRKTVRQDRGNNFQRSAYPTSLNGPADTPIKCMEDGYFVAGYIHDRSLAFLVDTGSCCTILSKAILESWPQETRPTLIPVNLHLVTATGESSPFIGKAELEITLGSQKLLHDVLFADVKNDGILGMDFLTKHHCDMFLSKNHLLLNGEKIACFRSSVDAVPTCSRIAILETVEVPPECEIIVEGRPIDRVDNSSIGILEATLNFVDRSGLLIARALVCPEFGTVPLRIMNLNPEPVKLYKKNRCCNV